VSEEIKNTESDLVEQAEAEKREEDREDITLMLRNAEIFHDCGIHLNDRTIFVGSDTHWDGGHIGVDAKMAEKFLKNLHMLERMSPDPVTVLANNPGGDVYHGLAIYDAIKTSRCAVRVVVRGYAMSMGSIILQAATRPGDCRVMGPTSTQMIHWGTDGWWGHAKTFEKIADEGKRINAWMVEMYLEQIRKKHPKFTKERLKNMLNFDTFLTAKQSIDLGLADEIG